MKVVVFVCLFALVRAAAQEGSHCTANTDCTRTQCDAGKDYTCFQNKCTCHDQSGGHVPFGKRQNNPGGQCMDNTQCANVDCHHGSPVCEHEHCHCKEPAKRIVHEGHHCTTKADCDSLNCSNPGEDYDCIDYKCTCHNHHGGNGKRQSQPGDKCSGDDECTNVECHSGRPICSHGHCQCH